MCHASENGAEETAVMATTPRSFVGVRPVRIYIAEFQRMFDLTVMKSLIFNEKKNCTIEMIFTTDVELELNTRAWLKCVKTCA